MKAITLCILLTAACATSRPPVTASPKRIDAVQLYMTGASTAEVASSLAVEPAEARELLRLTLRDLNRAYYRHH